MMSERAVALCARVENAGVCAYRHASGSVDEVVCVCVCVHVHVKESAVASRCMCVRACMRVCMCVYG